MSRVRTTSPPPPPPPQYFLSWPMLMLRHMALTVINKLIHKKYEITAHTARCGYCWLHACRLSHSTLQGLGNSFQGAGSPQTPKLWRVDLLYASHVNEKKNNRETSLKMDVKVLSLPHTLNIFWGGGGCQFSTSAMIQGMLEVSFGANVGIWAAKKLLMWVLTAIYIFLFSSAVIQIQTQKGVRFRIWCTYSEN